MDDSIERAWGAMYLTAHGWRRKYTHGWAHANVMGGAYSMASAIYIQQRLGDYEHNTVCDPVAEMVSLSPRVVSIDRPALDQEV